MNIYIYMHSGSFTYMVAWLDICRYGCIHIYNPSNQIGLCVFPFSMICTDV